MSFAEIKSMDEFNHIMENNNKFFLLKNSTTCPISHEAYKETENFATENEHVPVFYLHVQESRNLSNEIAERFSIKHESPQAILFQLGEVVWHESHWSITNKQLIEAWEK